VASFSIEIDPSAVLGVSRDASLQEIRDAYRAQAKRYHSDVGGEDWAFRIVSRSYEVLCTERVARASEREEQYRRAPRSAASSSPPPPPPPPPGGGSGFRTTPPPREWSNESVRAGVQDRDAEPSRVVDVERLSIRYQVDQIWLITDRNRGQNFLSCSLNVSWPDPALKLDPATVPDAATIVRDLEGILDILCEQTKALMVRSSVVDGRFEGWISYPNPERAASALARFRDLLHARGLAVKQWSRDLIIPREVL
jgi:hypothetical protein